MALKGSLGDLNNTPKRIKMNELHIWIIIALAIICCAACFRFGQNRPNSNTCMRIREEARKEDARELVAHKKWTCIKIISDYPGPLGSEMPVIVLEHGIERTAIVYYRKQIYVRIGDQVTFRMLNESDPPKHFWINSVDRYCFPQLLKQS